MIITKQNSIYVSQAISTVSGVPLSDVAWYVDEGYSLQIDTPEGVDVTLVEAEVPNVATETKLKLLRIHRNLLIAETDWWANSDLTMTAEQTAYRQALRDITDTYTSLDDVVWPTKP